ncbi:MAG: hypothetical protein LBT96_05240 [Campylobacteraceae bacterium]|nr:hypothetical protein [Campylobacteraceae bacterium]
MKICHGSGGDFLMFCFSSIFYTPYVVYLIIHTLFVDIFYKKILKFNIIAFILIFIIAMLNYTGFSYPKGHYLSKAEQIDIGLKGYLHTICYDHVWIKDKEKECPYTFEKLKERYPQCFTDERPDVCELYRYRKKYSFHPLGYTIVGAVYSKKLYNMTTSLHYYYDVYSNGDAGFNLSDDDLFKNF